MKHQNIGYFDILRRTSTTSHITNPGIDPQIEPDFNLEDDEIFNLNNILNKFQKDSTARITLGKGYIKKEAITLKYKIGQKYEKLVPATNTEVKAKLYYNDNKEKILEIEYLPEAINLRTDNKEFRKSHIGFIDGKTIKTDCFIPNKITILDKSNNSHELDLLKKIKIYYNLNTGISNIYYRNCSIALPDLNKNKTSNHPDMYIKITDSNNNNQLLRLYKRDNKISFLDKNSLTTGSWSNYIFRGYDTEETNNIKKLYEISEKRFNNLYNAILYTTIPILTILEKKEKSILKQKSL